MPTSSSPDRRAGGRACIPVAIVVAVLALAMPGRAVLAAESKDACTAIIDALPYGIDAPGTYCLASNLNATSNTLAAINIDFDDVVVDCNGFRIDGTNQGSALTAYGINAIDHADVTIRNCHVRGFKRGINLGHGAGAPSRRHVVEDNRIELSREYGIHVDGNGSVVRRNLVQSTINPATDNAARGISTVGNVDVIDNTVAIVQATNASVFGIHTSANAGGSIRGNRVRGVKRTGGVGEVVGINNLGDSQRMAIRDNNLTGEAQAGSVGVFCDVVTDRAKGNSVKGFPTGISNCGNDGNVVKP